MKLARIGAPGAECPAIVDSEGKLRDLSGEIAALTGALLSDAAIARLSALDVSALPEIVRGQR